MSTYTAKTVEVTAGLLPKFRKTVEQHHVFKDGEYFGALPTLAEAQEVADGLNSRDAAYAAQIAADGRPEWQMIDENSAG